ncbi:5'(3')-deoxyribonucleotidase [Lewinella marina]|uniref:5'(3')-deoxyribonucleotidase n=1 Tax=Neolewinella marina TaxID=438751 RepID=A0A2G0CBB4_9BACT|nr:5'(3')-deoxyribonucleotidase [Neolewinella marina]NJB87784.1 5'(3')-deoxyribonucleotidase [Neolewinella marina]PHK97254.1 5'(3')-deoxyribonucleotidase [Neolewinella marina]
MRICIDMDEVMVDNYQEYHRLFEKHFGRKVDPQEYYGKKIYELPGIESLRDELHRPGFFRHLPVMKDAREVVEELYENYEVYVVTAATEFKHCFTDKWEWLEEHMPFIHWERIVFCGNKSIVHGDYMIDDKVSNLNTFNGQGLLFTASHNTLDDGGYPRFDNWLEIRDYFRELRAGEIAGEG